MLLSSLLVGCKAEVTSAAKEINSSAPPGQKNKYTISFDLDGGTMKGKTNIVVEEGNALSIAEADKWKADYTPTKAVHSFQGWFSDKAKTKIATPKDYENYKVNNNLTFYAKWQINRYQVTFNVDGGSAVAAKTVNHGEKITAPSSMKSNANDSFYVEWYKDSQKIFRFDFANETITKDTTLYAKWLNRRITTKEFSLVGANDSFNGFDFYDGHILVYDNPDRRIYFYSTNDGSHQSNRDIKNLGGYKKVQYVPSKNGFFISDGYYIKFLNLDGTPDSSKDLLADVKATFYPDHKGGAGEFKELIYFYIYKNRIIINIRFWGIVVGKSKDFALSELSISKARDVSFRLGYFYTGKNFFYDFHDPYASQHHTISLKYYDSDFKENTGKKVFLQKQFSTQSLSVQVNPIIVDGYLYVLRANASKSIKKVFVYYIGDLLAR